METKKSFLIPYVLGNLAERLNADFGSILTLFNESDIFGSSYGRKENCLTSNCQIKLSVPNYVIYTVPTAEIVFLGCYQISLKGRRIESHLIQNVLLF